MKYLKKSLFILATIMSVFILSSSVSAETNFFTSYSNYSKHLAVPKTSKPRILLIGNSLTYYNYGNHGIQYVLSGLCQSNGINATVMDITKGGHYLYQCSDKSDPLHDTIEKAFEQKWDYVILQGHSTEMITHPDDMLETIRTYFQPKIKASGAQMVLYMTWAPDRDPYGNQGTYNRDSRQSAITNAYYKFGDLLNCAVAPSGLAFARAKELFPDLELHYSLSDRLHPSCIGTYLSACTIYATLFRKNPYGTEFYPAGTSEKNCSYMQSLAADVTTRITAASSARLTFSSKGYTVNKGKEKKLSTAASSGCRVIRWTSSNPEVVRVSSSSFTSCTVKALQNGRAKITALLNNNTTVSCDVIVTPTQFTMGVNEKYTLEFPNQFTWTSSKSSVAKVKKGVIVASKKGKTVLTGKDSSGVTVKLNVTVKSAPSSVKVAKTKIVGVGRQARLSASVKSGASYRYTYKSNNPDIISVDENGILTGKRTGKAKITVKSYNGKKAVCTVQCVILPQRISFANAESPLSIKRGKTKTLKVAFFPSNTTIKTLKWKSSNTKVVSVSAKGKITARKKGTATVSATTTDGSKKTIKIKIKVK